MKIEKLKDFIQSANINFLFGSGLSLPYLHTLGNIEVWLTELNDADIKDDAVKTIIKASILKEYFYKVIYPNLPSEIDTSQIIDNKYNDVLANYKNFFNLWSQIITRRSSNILNKQINIFTTNIDLFTETAAETIRIEFNDGFRGRINPVFDEGNFHKSYSKTSTHFQNTSEIPVFNFFKLHGSINWRVCSPSSTDLTCDNKLNILEDINQSLKNIDENHFINIAHGDSIENLKCKAEVLRNSFTRFYTSRYDHFLKLYSELVMINPSKRKFQETVLDLHFYELMRLYSNALEKENSILFVQGFSFADEHITQITLRAADSNPTLLIVVFVYDNSELSKFNENLKLSGGTSKNSNIIVITPDILKEHNEDSDFKDEVDLVTHLDFLSINDVIYKSISNMIPVKFK